MQVFDVKPVAQPESEVNPRRSRSWGPPPRALGAISSLRRLLEGEITLILGPGGSITRPLIARLERNALPLCAPWTCLHGMLTRRIPSLSSFAVITTRPPPLGLCHVRLTCSVCSTCSICPVCPAWRRPMAFVAPGTSRLMTEPIVRIAPLILECPRFGPPRHSPHSCSRQPQA